MAILPIALPILLRVQKYSMCTQIYGVVVQALIVDLAAVLLMAFRWCFEYVSRVRNVCLQSLNVPLGDMDNSKWALQTESNPFHPVMVYTAVKYTVQRCQGRGVTLCPGNLLSARCSVGAQSFDGVSDRFSQSERDSRRLLHFVRSSEADQASPINTEASLCLFLKKEVRPKCWLQSKTHFSQERTLLNIVLTIARAKWLL